MSTSDAFDDVVRQWVDIFMTRSHHHLVRYLKQAELSMAQFGTLMRLHHDANCGVGDIAEQMSISNAAASQLVDKLVQHGLVERTEDVNDRRAKRLRLTPKGHYVLERSRDARLAWTRKLADHLGAQQRASIIAALESLTAAAEAAEQEPAAEGNR
jgi:DNA-binding MarR family transcriptional regulator